MTLSINDIQYTFTITKLEMYPTFENYVNVVFSVHWKYEGVYTQSGTDKIYKNSITGNQSINTNDLQEFIPFEQLTKETVMSWISDSLDYTMFQTIIFNHIQDQMVIREFVNPPWE
jgi:hypothetical protein